jgi:hypothetical protein
MGYCLKGLYPMRLSIRQLCLQHQLLLRQVHHARLALL